MAQNFPKFLGIPMDLIAIRETLPLCRKETLHSICELFDLRRYGSKADMIARISGFVETASSDERNELVQILREFNPGIAPPSDSFGKDGLPRIRVSSFPSVARPGSTAGGPQLGATLPRDDLYSSFESIDPFFPIASVPKPFLFWTECRSGSSSFPVDIPDLKAMRRQGYSIWLRGISKSAGKNERQVWPKELRVFVNLSQAAKVDEPKRLKKRRDEPIDLSAYLQSGKNHVQISVSDPRPGNFMVALMVCRSSPNSAILESIRLEPHDLCKARIREILEVKSELFVDDGVDGFRRLDLRCPISLDKIKIAGRGVNCKHLRCFDLAYFLDVNRHTSNINLRWLCPICYDLLLPKGLVKDTFIQGILDCTSPDETEVLLNVETCEWSRVESNHKPVDSDSDEVEETIFRTEGVLNKPDVVVVDLDDDEEEDVPSPPLKAMRPAEDVQRPILRIVRSPAPFDTSRPLKIMRPPPVEKPSPDIIELD